MSLWTVDTWTVHKGKEQVFIDTLRSLLPDANRVFRDLEQKNKYWCPHPWENAAALDAWHAKIERELDALVRDHATYVMESVK